MYDIGDFSLKKCFVVGCARSGTSILGELIASHPDVKYIFEAHSTWEMGGLEVNGSHRLTSEYATDEVKSKIRKWFQEQAGKEAFLVEKNPRNILRIIRCGYAWREIVEIGLSDLQNTDHLQIRYEDLLANPAFTAEKIFQYLGLNLHEDVLAFCERISNDTNSSYHAKNQEQWYRQNHRSRMGRWRENLNEQDQETLTGILTPLLSRLGYPVIEDK
jgi:hypothetical protein